MRLYTLRWALAAVMLAASAAWAPAGPWTEDPTQTIVARAKRHLENNKPELAIDLLKNEIAKKPESVLLHYWLGRAYQRARRFDLAEAEFKDVRGKDPDYIDAYLRLAALSFRKVQAANPKPRNLALLETAIGYLKDAIKRGPLDTKPYYDVAALYISSARFREDKHEAAFAEAMKALEEARKQEPEEVRPFIALGNARNRHAMFIAAGTPLAELKGEKATKCSQLLDQAEADFRQALKINPRYLLALNRVAAIQANRGDLNKALQTLEAHVPQLKNSLEKATCYRWMAQYLMRDNSRLGEAEAKLNTAIKTEPKELASYLLLANVLLRRKLPQEAADTLKKAIAVQKNFLNGYVELGVLEKRRGNTLDATEHLKRAVNMAPNRAVVVSSAGRPVQRVLGDLYTLAAEQLGDIYVSLAKFDDAITVYRRLSTLMPAAPLPDFLIGQVHRRKGDLKTAKEHYAHALRRNKDFVRARLAMAEVIASEAQAAPDSKERAKVYNLAIDHFERAAESAPKTPGIFDQMARLRVLLANCTRPKDRAALDKALENAKKAVELAPKVMGFRRRLAGIHHELGNHKAAVAEAQKLIDEAKKLVEKDPENVNAIFTLAMLRSLLNTWQPDKALLKQALDGFELALKKQPQFLEGYRRAAMMLEQQKDYERSVQWYERLFKATKGDRTLETLDTQRTRYALHAAAELAWLCCEHLNRVEDAKKYAGYALRLNRDLPSLVDTVGWIHYKNKEYAKAIPYLRRAFKGAPTNATVGYHLGAALIAHSPNNSSRAKEVLLEALKHVDRIEDAQDRDKLKKKIADLLNKARD